MYIEEYTTYQESEVLALYGSVGWTAYTEQPEALRRGFAGSLLTLASRENGTLVGLLRAVGDGCTVVLVQDLLVRPDHHRHGADAGGAGALPIGAAGAAADGRHGENQGVLPVAGSADTAGAGVLRLHAPVKPHGGECPWTLSPMLCPVYRAVSAGSGSAAPADSDSDSGSGSACSASADSGSADSGSADFCRTLRHLLPYLRYSFSLPENRRSIHPPVKNFRRQIKNPLDRREERWYTTKENKEGRMHPPHLQQRQRGQQRVWRRPGRGAGFVVRMQLCIRVFIF